MKGELPKEDFDWLLVKSKMVDTVLSFPPARSLTNQQITFTVDLKLLFIGSLDNKQMKEESLLGNFRRVPRTRQMLAARCSCAKQDQFWKISKIIVEYSFSSRRQCPSVSRWVGNMILEAVALSWEEYNGSIKTKRHWLKVMIEVPKGELSRVQGLLEARLPSSWTYVSHRQSSRCLGKSSVVP